MWDTIDYPFEVLEGDRISTVKVGITGASHDPAEALGSKKLQQAELVQAASDWLRSRIAKGQCDPWNRPATDCLIDGSMYLLQ